MRLRKHELGIDFPYDRKTAEVAQQGQEDERLRMDSILFDALDALALRRALMHFPNLREQLKLNALLEPDLANDFIKALHKAKQNEPPSSRTRKFDRAISKCQQWRKKGLPIFVDI